MSIGDFGYSGKRVLVVGGASGIGAAAAQTAAAMGAEAVVMDVAEVDYPARQVIKVDLRDRDSVDAAADQVQGPIHAVFSCAGVADGVRGVMLINFISQRHLLQRLLAKGNIGRGGAVVMVSSVAGLGWEKKLSMLQDFLKTPDWESAVAWVAGHVGTDTYGFSKQAMNAYIAGEAFRLLQEGIRINAIMPGPTDTPLARANADIWLTFGSAYRKAAGVETLVPQQMANAMAFLGCSAASGVTGITLLVDQGHISSGVTSSFADPVVKHILGMA